MAQINVTRDFNAPLDKLWDIAGDFSRWGEWNTMFTKWKEEPPATADVQVGSQVVAVLTILGMANTITLTTKEYEPPKRIVLTGTGMAGAEITLGVSASEKDGNTTLSLDSEFTSAQMVGAIGQAVERAAKAELTASLDKVAALVE